jgi:predicted MPP superfamily phosphohydrolase
MGPWDRISLIIFFVVALLFLVFELRVAIGFLVKNGPGHAAAYTRKKWARIAAGIGAVIAVAAAVDAFFIEPDWVVEEYLTLTSPKIKRHVRIVQISDLHTEGFGKRHEKALAIVRKAKPDVIVLTGDYLNGRKLQYLPELRRFVSQLQAPLGIYAIEGNFEFDQKPWKLFRELGIEVLLDRAVNVKEVGLTICGLRCEWDLRESEKDFLRELAAKYPDNYALLMCHYPNHIEEPETAFADLYLCGHTHGGQVRLPLWGAIVTLSKTGKKYECGHYTHGKTHIYVNRGLGMEGGAVPRVRFLCRPEVTIIDIHPAR